MTLSESNDSTVAKVIKFRIFKVFTCEISQDKRIVRLTLVSSSKIKTVIANLTQIVPSRNKSAHMQAKN